MGTCLNHTNNQQRNRINTTYLVDSNNLNQKQQFLLKLIYNDLKLRIPEKAINLENFLLFFHKNGFWGTRLFHQFTPSSNLINEEQFISGMAKLIKKDEQKKIELLFKFFSGSYSSSEQETLQIQDCSYILKRKESGQESPNRKQKGVKFSEFLLMLYNYPKEDLKQILNDKDFFQKQIRNSLVTIGQSRRLDSVYGLGIPLNKRKELVFRVEDKSETSESGTDENSIEMQPSMLGKDILRQIKIRETDQTTLKLKDGDKTLEVKTSNIHHLVKRFAFNMFKSFNLDIEHGELNIRQFSQWIKEHNTLYKNYYDGFHNDVWEFDPDANECKYLVSPSQKQGISKYQVADRVFKAYVMLKHSVIVVCEEQVHTNPVDVICLEGLEVTKIFEEQQGYGFLISHRDGFYPQKKIFLKNESIRDDWNDSLKYFRGGSVQNAYCMGKKIGTGKFSVVYEAINRQTKDQVAIKVIDFKELDMAARKMIAHESSIMQIFSHPLLVQFKRCIQSKTHLYIITELCPGRDLFEHVKDVKCLSEKQAACIIQQIIVGVRYMHSLGIVHRDLKPENIMVSYNESEKKIETVKIIDFGFANYLTAFSSMSPDQILAGTPNYIAPELLLGEKITYKSDNFAIGSILYFMLSGNLPFNSRELADIFAKTLEGNYSFKGKCWEKVSKNAKNLIEEFLRTDPQKRISLQDALKHAWFKEIKEKSPKKSTQPNRLIESRKSIENEGMESTRQTSN